MEKPLKNPAAVFRSLSTMISAGIAIHHALELLAESAEDSDDSEIMESLAAGISTGRTLSICMSEHPKAFSAYIVGLVRMGERTGALARLLDTIAGHTEKSEALRLKLRSAVTYPAFLITGALTMMMVGPSYVLEGQLKMLQQSGQELPRLTRLMIWWSELIGSPLFLLAVALMLGGSAAALSDPERRRRIWVQLHRIPILEEFLKLMASARFARSLEVALKSGLPVLQALPLAATASGDPLLERRIEVAKQELIAGDTVSGSLRAIGFFPSSFASLVESGEEAGKLPLMLALIAQFAELELELTIRKFTTLIEPAILLVMGVFTALVLVATLQPTISLLQTL